MQMEYLSCDRSRLNWREGEKRKKHAMSHWSTMTNLVNRNDLSLETYHEQYSFQWMNINRFAEHVETKDIHSGFSTGIIDKCQNDVLKRSSMCVCVKYDSIESIEYRCHQVCHLTINSCRWCSEVINMRFSRQLIFIH